MTERNKRHVSHELKGHGDIEGEGGVPRPNGASAKNRVPDGCQVLYL